MPRAQRQGQAALSQLALCLVKQAAIRVSIQNVEHASHAIGICLSQGDYDCRQDSFLEDSLGGVRGCGESLPLCEPLHS